MKGSPYAVIVCDLFHSHDPDHETVVEGFPTRELAIEYARRRVWSSVEEMREPDQSRERLRSLWRSLGEDCRVVGPEGMIYVASSEIERFLDRPATPEERDWVGLYRSLLPEDFSLTYRWVAGTYPPPHHYEYIIAVGPGDEGRITFWPDYPGEGVPEWQEPFHPDLRARIVLFNLMQAAGLFAPTREVAPEPTIGGEMGYLEVTAAGRDARLALHALSQAERDELHRAIRAVVPDRLWGELGARRQRYIERTYPGEA